jgi:hypothetical protein
LANEIEAAGGHALPIQADVSDPTAVNRIFSSTETAFGAIDVLVNNAGIMHSATLAEADDAFSTKHIAASLKGTFNCLREAAKRLRNGGRIINSSSSVVGLYQPSYSIYAAAMRAWRRERSFGSIRLTTESNNAASCGIPLWIGRGRLQRPGQLLRDWRRPTTARSCRRWRRLRTSSFADGRAVCRSAQRDATASTLAQKT